MIDYKQEYKKWSEALKDEELSNLAQDEAMLEDSFYKNLEFGTAGMRGIIGIGLNRMNIYTVRRSTQGLANYINEAGAGERGVAIAYDCRNKSEEFALEAALVLCKNGITTYLYDTIKSVPQLSFTVLHLNCFAGIVITASHNPSQYNGYKVYGEDGGQLAVEGAKIVTQHIDAIEDIFSVQGMKESEAIDAGLLKYIGEEIDEEYYKNVLSLTMNKDVIKAQSDSLNVIYTPLHGTGNIPVQHVLKSMGIHKLAVVKQQQAPDGNFPTVKAPNPEEKEAFTLAIELANQKDANMIIATDPDCDRMGLAVRDKTGDFKILSGNEIGCLLMDYVLSQKRPSFTGEEFVVKSIVSTDMADVIASHYGVDIRRVLTGFRFIAEQIKISLDTGVGKFVFGFEESYGYLSGTFVRDKDACIACMLTVEAACYYASLGKTLCDAVDGLYKKYGFFKEKVLSLTLAGIEGIEKIQGAVEYMRQNPPTDFDGIPVLAISDIKTGVKKELRTQQTEKIDLPSSNVLIYTLEDARVILRPSGTEPKLKSYVSLNAKDESAAAQAHEKLVKFVWDLMNKLTE